MSRQMSSAMMSAPSAASRTACARPWPRAAPVMKATLPFRFPTGSAPLVSVGNAAGVNPCLPQAFLRIIDLDVPVVARARAAVVAVDGQDRLAVTGTAAVGDAGEEFERLLVESAVIGHGGQSFSSTRKTGSNQPSLIGEKSTRTDIPIVTSAGATS